MSEKILSPFFSIVIPTYNRKATIKNTIESILQQSFKDYEILVIDDGSTDGTFESLTDYYSVNPAIKIIHQENKERGAARNNGFQHAQGVYVIFLDSDDLLLSGHLKALSEKIEEQKKPDFICTKYELYRNGKTYSSDIQHLQEGFHDYKLFLTGNPLACNICVRRGNKNLHLFEEDRSYSIKEDWMFMLQNLRNNKFYLIDKVTIRMEDHDDRSMRSDNNLIIEHTFNALDWILKKIPLDDHEKKILEAHANYFCSIHSYIDNKRRKALKFLLRSFRLNGLQKKYLVLLAKLSVGKNIADIIKRKVN